MSAAEVREAAESIRRASNEAASVDPADFERLDEALQARGACIDLLATVAQQLPEANPSLEEAAAALAAAHEQGDEMLLRLRLARAALQTELRVLQREQRLLNGLDLRDPAARSVDYSG